jgi:AcrR family transcriptional regulator
MLRQAARLFAERGFRGTSVEDIGAACGVTGPAVYKHFSGKDAILARLLVDISEQLVEGGRQVAEGESDPRRALEQLVEFHTDFALGEPDLIRVQDRDLPSLNERDRTRVRRLQRAYVEHWTRVLQRCEPTLEEATARLRVQAVFGLLNSTPHSAHDRKEARRQLIGMALRALTGSQARDGRS